MSTIKQLANELAGLTPFPISPAPATALETAARLYTVPGRNPGMLAPGNIDLAHRPIAHNPDGSISTVRSISVGLDNGQVALLPTVIGGRVVSNQAAVNAYRRNGKHLGVFTSEANAERYAEKLHQEQARAYTGGP